MRTLLLILSLVILPQVCWGGEKYVIGIPVLDQCGEYADLEKIMHEAYSRAGLNLEISCLPMLRELEEASDNTIAGITARSGSSIDAQPELMRIPTPLFHYEAIAFSAKPGIKLNSIEDLAAYDVGVQRGFLSIIRLVEHHTTSLYQFNVISSGLEMLRRGRLDIIVDDPAVFFHAATEQGVKVYALKTLEKGYYYHAVNKKHADIVPKLDKAFREMFEDGTMQELAGKYRDALANQNQ